MNWLLLNAFMASIDDQFEFVQRNWMSNPPQAMDGPDPVIGASTHPCILRREGLVERAARSDERADVLPLDRADRQAVDGAHRLDERHAQAPLRVRRERDAAVGERRFEQHGLRGEVPLDGAVQVEMIAAEGGTAVAHAGDMTIEAECKGLVDAAVDRWGRLDLLDNNVGIGSMGSVVEETEENWQRCIEKALALA